MSTPIAELWSDIDGTALEKLSAKNPRDWWRNGMKRNLAAMQGYLDFLRGVQAVQDKNSAGIAIGGLVSKRYEWMRRRATARSVSQVGLSEFVGEGRGQVVLAGGEKAKAKFIAERSRETVVGMIEDRPHKLGKSLLGYALKNGQLDKHHPILLGVVSHSSSYECISDLRSELRHRPGTDGVTVHGEIGTNTGLVAYMGPLEVHVTQLEPYSEEEGQRFGEKLQALSAAEG